MSSTPISDRIRTKCSMVKGHHPTKAILLAHEALELMVEAHRMQGDFYGPRQVAMQLQKALRKAERAALIAMGGK